MKKSGHVFNILFAEVLKKGKVIRLPVSGLSMYPTLKEGDILKVKPIVYQDARIGDILAYENFETKKVFVHRLVKKITDSKSNYMLTIAEAAPRLSYDSPINPNNCIIAKVIAIERGKRIINLEERGAQLCSKIIAYLLVKFPLAIILRRKCVRAIEAPYLIPQKIFQFFKKVINLSYKI